MKRIVIVLVFTLPYLLQAQTKVNATWTKVLGGTSYENPIYPVTLVQTHTVVVTDDQENLYVSSNTYSEDIDINASYGNIDAWILKLNSKGDTLWTLVIGGTYDDVATDIVINPAGGCVVVGYTYSDDGVFFNTGHHGDNERPDGFVAIIDKDGKLTNLKQYGSKVQLSKDPDGNEVESGGNDELYSVISTKDGNFMCVGSTNSYADDLGPLDDTQFWAGWFLKISPTGKRLSSKKITHNIDEPFYYIMKLFDVVESDDGNYVAFGEVADLNNVFWAVKTDGLDNTNKMWSETYSAQTFQSFGGFVKKQDGNYAVANVTLGGAGDQNIQGWGAGDVWVFEIDDQDGSILNQNLFGGSGGDIAKSMISLKNGNLLISGFTNSTDGDCFGGYGAEDFWMLELQKESLDTVRVHKFGGSGYDIMYSAAESNDGKAFYVAGLTTSNDPANFGYIHENKGGSDLFFAKIETDPTLSVEKINPNSQSLVCIQTEQKNVFKILNSKNSTIQIYDILGNKILSQKAISETEIINLQNFSKGIYLVKREENISEVCKVVID